MFNYGNQYLQPQIPRYQTYQPYNNQPIQPQVQQPQMQTYTPQPTTPIIQGLQGKTVDSIDVVKAMDIPLDGSISFFPLVDGTAIVTKQLQQDGTSKTLIYKPVDNKEEVKQPIYITPEQLEEKMKGFNSKEIKDIKEEIKSLKREIRDITDEIKDKRED